MSMARAMSSSVMAAFRKWVVVAGQEQAPADAFSHPLLMEHQAVVVGDPQVEEGRFAGDH